MCLEKMYGRQYSNFSYPHSDLPTHPMSPFVDHSFASIASSSPPSIPRSPLPNQLYSRNEPPPDVAMMGGSTSMRGYMYKKSIKNDISIWRRRYFYLLTPEGRLMQYEDDQVYKALFVYSQIHDLYKV